MTVLLLDDISSISKDFRACLNAGGNHLKISPDYNTLGDCQRWLEANAGSALSIQASFPKMRSRIVVKRGKEFQILKVCDIAYFFTEHKMVFVVDKENRRFLFEKNTLGKLERELDKNMFYRANRKYLINADYIKSFKSIARYKVKLKIFPDVNEDVIISQENSVNFRKWIGEY